MFTLLFISSILNAQIEQRGIPLTLHKKSLAEYEIPEYNLPEFDIDSFRNQIAIFSKKKKLQYAKVFDVDLNIKDLAESYRVNNGTLYLYSVRSTDAFSLFLGFDSFKVPPGARLFIYNTDYSHVKGAMTHANNRPSEVLPVTPVQGEKVTIEYFEPDQASFKGKLKLGKIGHDVLDIFNVLSKGTAGVGDSDTCHVNINCPEGEDWQEVKRAITKIVTGGGYLCSGALVNNTNYDRQPYLLTADHCIDDSAEAANSIFYFNYESPECDTSYIELEDQSMSGAQLISAAPESKLDFSLLKLESDVPSNYRPYFAGWSIDTTNVTNTTCIHHPMGDVKKITIDEDAPVIGSFGDTYEENTHWRILEWDVGTTEGGSSGSPLFNQNKQIIGNLTGGEASCEYNYNDYFAMFSYSWDLFGQEEYQMEYWLDPNNTGFDNLDGYKPYDTIPSNVRAIYQETYVNVKWNSVIDSSDMDYYEIFRNGEKIGEFNGTSFDDVVPVKDSLYFYQVRGILDSGDSTVFSDSVGIYPIQPLSVPYSYSFEDTQSLESGWYEQSSSHDTFWSSVSDDPAPSPDGNYHYAFNAEKDISSKLVTPGFDLEESEYFLLTFEYYLEEFENNIDELSILIRYADSLPWKQVASFNEATSDWEADTLLLPRPSYGYKIAFEGNSKGGGGVYLDNINVFSDPDGVDFNFSASSFSLCEGDSLAISIDTNDVFGSYTWDMGYGAEPRYVEGYGPHQIKYTYPGIRTVELLVDGKYEIVEKDFIEVDSIPQPEISRNEDSIISNYEEGNQWYRNDERIPGATSKVYIVQDTGTYKVKVTNQNGCSNFSNEIDVLQVGLSEQNDGDKPFKIYPNPARNILILEFTSDASAVEADEFSIFDVTGKKIKSRMLSGEPRYEISLEVFDTGIFFLRVDMETGDSYTKRFIKK